MKVINRKEFRQIWQQLDARLGKEDSPLWIPEQHKGSRPSRWFVAVTPLALVEHDQWQQFWQWYLHCVFNFHTLVLLASQEYFVLIT